jgi:hypothetical protein
MLVLTHISGTASPAPQTPYALAPTFARYQQRSPVDMRRSRTQQATPPSGPRNAHSGRKHPSLGYLSSRLTSSELRSRHNAVDVQ